MRKIPKNKIRTEWAVIEIEEQVGKKGVPRKKVQTFQSRDAAWGYWIAIKRAHLSFDRKQENTGGEPYKMWLRDKAGDVTYFWAYWDFL